MDSAQFIRQSRRQAGRIATYINDIAPSMVVRKTLRFIDGNFRAQGWQGSTFQKWKDKQSNKGKDKPGQILIVTGRLRRGVNYTTNGRGEVLFYNNVPYAKIHNQGGTINTVAHVNGFSRRRFYTDEVSAPGARKTKFVKTKISEHQVKSHTRKMKIVMPQRQFMPYEDHGSPVLDNSIKRDLDREINKILTL
jgi:phage gpG-like protein